MTESEAWDDLRHEQSRVGRRAFYVWLVWTVCYFTYEIIAGFSWWSYPIFLGIFLWALHWFVIRPVKKASTVWDKAINEVWDVPPPLMQGTLRLYDDSHGFKVGDKVPMDEHLYEVVAVNGAEIEVREVPRAAGSSEDRLS